jgi:hypothetical protein
VLKKIEAEAALANCCALINQNQCWAVCLGREAAGASGGLPTVGHSISLSRKSTIS